MDIFKWFKQRKLYREAFSFTEASGGYNMYVVYPDGIDFGALIMNHVGKFIIKKGYIGKLDSIKYRFYFKDQKTIDEIIYSDSVNSGTDIRNYIIHYILMSVLEYGKNKDHIVINRLFDNIEIIINNELMEGM